MRFSGGVTLGSVSPAFHCEKSERVMRNRTHFPCLAETAHYAKQKRERRCKNKLICSTETWAGVVDEHIKGAIAAEHVQGATSAEHFPGASAAAYSKGATTAEYSQGATAAEHVQGATAR